MTLEKNTKEENSKHKLDLPRQIDFLGIKQTKSCSLIVVDLDLDLVCVNLRLLFPIYSDE